MPPVRTTASIKPMKTERSHEENQERAYIAASRRSDRSLEARVESARRASEIHEKRTGRRLRVTEQDVINEEMYEEEDDNVSRRYRQLGLFPNLAALNPEFRRRVEAQIVVDMERSNMVAGAAQNSSLGMFGNHFSPFGNAAQAQYMNPWMMQMPQAGQQSPLLPTSIYSFGQPSPGLAPPMHQFGQISPGASTQMYPPSPVGQVPTPQSLSNDQQPHDRPNFHHRSASIAAPQHISTVRQQQSPIVHESVKAQRLEDRRMSLPPNVAVPSSKSPKNAPSPATSQHSANSQPHISRSQTYAGPVNTSPKSTQSTSSHPYGPLTPTLPMNTQQILGMPLGTGEQSMHFANPQMYNYNPNGTLKNNKKRNHDTMAASTGLEQTLMPTALDTGIHNNTSSLYDSPASTNTDAFSAAMTEPGYGLGFHNDDFAFDPFNASNSSGHGSPEEFSSFLNGDLFADQPAF